MTEVSGSVWVLYHHTTMDNVIVSLQFVFVVILLWFFLFYLFVL